MSPPVSDIRPPARRLAAVPPSGVSALAERKRRATNADFRAMTGIRFNVERDIPYGQASIHVTQPHPMRDDERFGHIAVRDRAAARRCVFVLLMKLTIKAQNALAYNDPCWTESYALPDGTFLMQPSDGGCDCTVRIDDFSDDKSGEALSLVVTVPDRLRAEWKAMLKGWLAEALEFEKWSAENEK